MVVLELLKLVYIDLALIARKILRHWGKKHEIYRGRDPPNPISGEAPSRWLKLDKLRHAGEPRTNCPCTADMYGCGENERLVGRAIKDCRGEVILATKLGNVRDERGNPRAGVEIQSVDLVYGKDKNRGVQILLAVTVATAQRAAGQAFSPH